MARSQVQINSYMLKRPSTSTASTSYTKDIKVIDADDSKSQNNVDLSWLPNYNDNNKNFGTNSNNSSHQNGQQEFDDSWLPTYNDTKRNVTTTTTPSKSNNSMHSRKAKIDSDDSWLPSTTIVKNENKNNNNHSHDSWLPNYNYNNKKSPTAASRSIKPNQLRITENDSDDSWLPNNGSSENKKENNHKNLRNNDHWDRACEVTQYAGARQVQHAKVLKNRPESSTSQQQVSSSKAECIVETDSLGGVSNLLRKWKVLDETINSNHTSSDTNNSKSRSSLTSPNRTSDVSSSADLESCKSNLSMPLACLTSSQSTNHSKATYTQKEKTLVVDTVRKLSIEEEELAASQAATSNLDGQHVVGENRCFPPVIGKTRLIRGRQAFNDFLYAMEQDRLRELESLTQRKPVSKFPNRGRIQASLRVRLIRLGAEPEKEAKSHNKRSVSRTMKTIWDKFSAGVKQGSSASRKVNNNEQETKCHAISEYSVGCNPEREVEVSATYITNNQEKESVTKCNQVAQKSIDHHELKESTIDQSQDIDSSPADSIQPKEDTHYGLNDSIQLHSEMELENFHNWISEYSQSQSDWEEEDEEFYYNHDWISEIARPKSDWEYLRQKRHQEMLYMYSYNQDLQQLLQRKSVSSFLSSGERDKLDQLMVSRAQGDSFKQEFVMRESRKQEVGGRSKIERHRSEYNGQTTRFSTPGQPRTWSHPTPNYDSNQMTSPSPSLWQNNAPQSSSIEMELIYDLRGYVEQLHQQIIELRKSINMQQLEAEKSKSERINTKRNCSVCYAVQADSFLYRCGHMCTCYTCGLELQYKSGKCPICEAPIVDVVRAYGYDE